MAFSPRVGAAALAAAVVVAACTGSRKTSFHLVNQPAAGRPVGCPDDSVDPFGDGTPGPMDARCSYDDAIGEGVTRLGGKVIAEGDPGIPGEGLSDMRVTVHRLGKSATPGEPIAHATTDAQGSFHVSAVLPAGEYVVIVRSVDGGPTLAQHRMTLEGERARSIEDLVLALPQDPRLRQP